jgi:hypothetical protein
MIISKKVTLFLKILAYTTLCLTRYMQATRPKAWKAYDEDA